VVIMHCIDDKPNGINHDGDWSGDVRIAWYDPTERPREFCPTPASLRECWCDGPDLVAGRFTPLLKDRDDHGNAEPPLHVLTRAVALAVETFLRSKMESAVDDLFIQRGKL
jgi:hypothetical protein